MPRTFSAAGAGSFRQSTALFPARAPRYSQHRAGSRNDPRSACRPRSSASYCRLFAHLFPRRAPSCGNLRARCTVNGRTPKAPVYSVGGIPPLQASAFVCGATSQNSPALLRPPRRVFIFYRPRLPIKKRSFPGPTRSGIYKVSLSRPHRLNADRLTGIDQVRVLDTV